MQTFLESLGFTVEVEIDTELEDIKKKYEQLL
jgi:hypothetical protein